MQEQALCGFYSRGLYRTESRKIVVRAKPGDPPRGFEIFLCRTQRSRDAQVCALPAGRPSTSFPAPARLVDALGAVRICFAPRTPLENVLVCRRAFQAPLHLASSKLFGRNVNPFSRCVENRQV